MKLSNIKLKGKMLFIVALPILLVLYYSGHIVLEKYRSVNNLEKISEVSDFNVTIGNFIHETQKERGLSSMFLSSKGQKGAEKLKEQRKLTELKKSLFDNSVSHILNQDVDTSLTTRIKNALIEVEKISETRSKIDNQGISATESAGYYTKMNALLIDIIFHSIKLSNNPELSSNIGAYTFLMKEKEMAGLERASLSGAFAADSFSSGQIKLFITAMAQQEDARRSFKLYASPEQAKYYNENLAGNFMSETQNMRDIAFQKIFTGKFSIKSEYWFKLQTEKIDHLKIIEDKLANDLKIVNTTLKKEASKTLIIYALITIISVLITMFFTYIIVTNIIVSIGRLISTIRNLASSGNLNNEVAINGKDEVAEIGTSINQLINMMKSSALFAKKIGQNELDADYQSLSNEDILGNSLLDMRNQLISSKKEEERRKEEDLRRNWATAGYAKFGELLRQNNDDMNELGYSIISNLVKYMNANQGGIFIINDENKNDSFLELTASYAFNRRKYIEKKIGIHEGLVGMCVLEAQTIYLTEIPQDYLEITSGLGEANPNALILVPLKINEDTFGVLEIASFTPFEPYQREFLEKIGESIASTISSVKVNVRTAQLLETSQQQTEMMRAQEEEMRQNMEEMHATQEELQRKESMTQDMIERMRNQESELKENLAAMAEKERYTQDLIETMKQQEEEMRQNMEEMHATQEEMAKKDEEQQRQVALLMKEIEDLKN